MSHIEGCGLCIHGRSSCKEETAHKLGCFPREVCRLYRITYEANNSATLWYPFFTARLLSQEYFLFADSQTWSERFHIYFNDQVTQKWFIPLLPSTLTIIISIWSLDGNLCDCAGCYKRSWQMIDFVKPSKNGKVFTCEFADKTIVVGFSGPLSPYPREEHRLHLVQ